MSWISCDRETPELGKSVLCWVSVPGSRPVQKVLRRSRQDSRFWTGQGNSYSKTFVTHWQPLPLPPRDPLPEPSAVTQDAPERSAYQIGDSVWVLDLRARFAGIVDDVVTTTFPGHVLVRYLVHLLNTSDTSMRIKVGVTYSSTALMRRDPTQTEDVYDGDLKP